MEISEISSGAWDFGNCVDRVPLSGSRKARGGVRNCLEWKDKKAELEHAVPETPISHKQGTCHECSWTFGVEIAGHGSHGHRVFLQIIFI